MTPAANLKLTGVGVKVLMLSSLSYGYRDSLTKLEVSEETRLTLPLL
jgi:hypothetical protein